MNQRKHVRGATGFACCLLAAMAAAPAARGDTTLPALVVSAAAIPPGLGIETERLPYSVQRISGADRREAGGDITDVMARRLTGVNTNEIAGNAFLNDVSFHGFRASPTLGTAQGMSVYLDGIRINEAFGDVVNWDMLPQAALDDTLLVAGSNPLYGLNTLGGTLAFTTKSGRTHPGLSAELSVASHGRRQLDLTHGAQHDNGLHSFVAATLFDEAGWRDHSGGSLANLFAKLGGRQGMTSWELSLLHGRSRLHGNGLLPSYRWQDGAQQNGLYEDSRSAAYTYPDRTQNRLTQVGFNLRHAPDDATELTLTAYLRHSRRDSVNGDVSAAYGDYVESCAAGFNADGSARQPQSCPYDRDSAGALHPASLNMAATRQRSAGASLNLTRYLERHQLLLGAAVDASLMRYSQTQQDGWFGNDRGVIADPQADVEQEAAVTGRSTALGLYASDTWQATKQTALTGSARLNQVEVSNTIAGQAQERFIYTKLNPALGAVHSLNNAVALFANLGQSNRVPTVIELGCADPQHPCRLPVGLQSDPYLKQVVSRTAEAGVRLRTSERGTLTLSAYRSVNRDDILFLTSGTQGYFANFERTLRQGVDISATARFGSIDAFAGYSFLDATYDASGVLFYGERNVQIAPGTRMAGLPRHTFKAGASWHATPRLMLGGSMLALSSVVSQGNEDGLLGDPAAGETPQRADWRVRGYAIFNASISYKSEGRWELFGGISNLFDRRYETYGALAVDMFPGGRLAQPHAGTDGADIARFVAPGAPRTISIGVRYRM